MLADISKWCGQLIRLFGMDESRPIWDEVTIPDGLTGKGVYSKTSRWDFWKMRNEGFPKTTPDVWLGNCLKLLAEIMVEVPATPLAPLQHYSQ